MTNRKSKRFKFSAPTALQKQMSETMVRGTKEVGTLHTEMVPLDRLEPDPDNPRELPFGVDDVRRYLADGVQPENAGKEWDSLLEMSETIRHTGVIQLISVYRHIDHYRIATGERRYLASHLAGLSSIPARIYPEKPSNLRLMQFVENAKREDLSLWKRINNVRAAIEEWQQQNDEPITGVRLKELLGVSTTQAGQYLTLVNSTPDVEKYIKDGQLTNLDKAATVARMPNAERRQAALLAMESGATIADIRKTVRQPAKTIPTKTGRPKTRVNLGSVQKGCVVKEILSRVGDELIMEDVDWGDLGNVERVWKAFLKELEARCK